MVGEGRGKGLGRFLVDRNRRGYFGEASFFSGECRGCGRVPWVR